jgi:integration host factor subunit beta
MTKRELIEAVANARSHLPRRDVETLVNAVFKSLSEALTRGERIEIRGFGSFIVKRRNAREGLNPKTGESVSVAAKRVPFFKAGKELKIRVDQKPGQAEPEPRKATVASATGLGESRPPLASGTAVVAASQSED